MMENSDEYNISSFVPVRNYFFSLSESLALKIYSDSTPKNMKIADLQKGLILLCNGIDVVGEGTGFGVPIAKYNDETFFSGSSLLHFRNKGGVLEIRKEFVMNMVARDSLRNLNLENQRIRELFDYVSELYQSHDYLAQSILLFKALFFRMGLQSSFKLSPDRGRVVVNYQIEKKHVLVKLDFGDLKRANLSKVFVLNEQGADFFSIYTDSEGLKLADNDIGAWNHVTANSARISDSENKIGFGLKNMKGSILRRGRERMEESLNWIGLDYEVNPKSHLFEYEIELFG
jgi:hypothetical protein